MRKLSAVYGHETIFVGGVYGELPKTLTTDTKKFGNITSVALEINDTDNVISITLNGKDTFCSPASNFKLWVPALT